MIGQKHLIQCKCILPHFLKRKDPPLHQFSVFSIIDDNDEVQIKYVQCPNCNSVHKITNINRSEIIQSKEKLPTSITIEDIKLSLPKQLVTFLETYECDLSTYEQAQFILEQQQWGNIIILSSENIDGIRQGKYLKILGQTLYKIEQFTQNEYIITS